MKTSTDSTTMRGGCG